MAKLIIRRGKTAATAVDRSIIRLADAVAHYKLTDTQIVQLADTVKRNDLAITHFKTSYDTDKETAQLVYNEATAQLEQASSAYDTALSKIPTATALRDQLASDLKADTSFVSATKGDKGDKPIVSLDTSDYKLIIDGIKQPPTLKGDQGVQGIQGLPGIQGRMPRPRGEFAANVDYYLSAQYADVVATRSGEVIQYWMRVGDAPSTRMQPPNAAYWQEVGALTPFVAASALIGKLSAENLSVDIVSKMAYATWSVGGGIASSSIGISSGLINAPIYQITAPLTDSIFYLHRPRFAGELHWIINNAEQPQVIRTTMLSGAAGFVSEEANLSISTDTLSLVIQPRHTVILTAIDKSGSGQQTDRWHAIDISTPNATDEHVATLAAARLMDNLDARLRSVVVSQNLTVEQTLTASGLSALAGISVKVYTPPELGRSRAVFVSAKQFGYVDIWGGNQPGTLRITDLAAGGLLLLHISERQIGTWNWNGTSSVGGNGTGLRLDVNNGPYQYIKRPGLYLVHRYSAMDGKIEIHRIASYDMPEGGSYVYY